MALPRRELRQLYTRPSNLEEERQKLNVFIDLGMDYLDIT